MGNTKKILNNLTFIGKKLENIGVSIGDTIDFFSPIILLNSVDFPTLGFPIIEI